MNKRKIKKYDTNHKRKADRGEMREALTNIGVKVAPWNDPSVRWVCEDHHTEEQSHLVNGIECGGAGMPEPTEENRKKGYIE